MNMYHYSVPPPGYVRYDYDSSPSSSPAPEEDYKYYRPAHASTPSRKKHARHASDYTGRGPAGWHSPAGFPGQVFYEQRISPLAAKQAFVNTFARNTKFAIPKLRRASTSQEDERAHRHTFQSPQRIIIDTSDEAEEPPVAYHYGRPRHASASKNTTPKRHSVRTDQFRFATQQVPVYDRPSDSHATRSRARRSSNATPNKATPRPATSGGGEPRLTGKTKKSPSPHREATPGDAVRAGIPAGYSTKNWDPTESPVLLLGSVFDANSLGKWIYDWTVFHHGPATPVSEVAGDLWLLLIKLAGKMKRADECLPRVRNPESFEMVEDFLESGDRLWGRLKRLLKACEEYMWRAATLEEGRGASAGNNHREVKMGKNSGCEFVETIFGRDRRLEETEALMQGVRLWCVRFDANCEEILRRPGMA